MRAQASIETLIIFAVGLFILTVFTAMIFDQITIQQIVQQQQIGQQSVRILAQEVDNVYFLGSGSKKELTIIIPEMTDFSKSSIENKTFVLNIANNDIFASTKADIRGEWPNASGSFVFIIESFGDFVSISTTTISFSPVQINESLNQGSSRQITLEVFNARNVPSSYNFSIDFDDPNVSITSSQDGNILNFFNINDSNIITIDLYCSNNSAGNYSASLIFSGVISVTYLLNLTCLSGQTRLTVYPSEKNLLLLPNQQYSENFLVCNNSKT
ncbi:MAG: hypothetical protein PHP82_04140, partial [Candidatus ainarchaeum sp.]|nr:hypothetical protein [Candidatus ainarchaeum sp.]